MSLASTSFFLSALLPFSNPHPSFSHVGRDRPIGAISRVCHALLPFGDPLPGFQHIGREPRIGRGCHIGRDRHIVRDRPISTIACAAFPLGNPLLCVGLLAGKVPITCRRCCCGSRCGFGSSCSSRLRLGLCLIVCSKLGRNLRLGLRGLRLGLQGCFLLLGLVVFARLLGKHGGNGQVFGCTTLWPLGQ